MVTVMSDLKYLLMFLSVTSKDQKEYLVFVNTLAKLLMGDKPLKKVVQKLTVLKGGKDDKGVH